MIIVAKYNFAQWSIYSESDRPSFLKVLFDDRLVLLKLRARLLPKLYCTRSSYLFIRRAKSQNDLHKLQNLQGTLTRKSIKAHVMDVRTAQVSELQASMDACNSDTCAVRNKPFPSSLVPLLQNESKCETFYMKMSSACSFISMKIKVIFIRMVSHLDSL